MKHEPEKMWAVSGDDNIISKDLMVIHPNKEFAVRQYLKLYRTFLPLDAKTSDRINDTYRCIRVNVTPI